MTELRWAEIFNTVVLPLIAIVVSCFLVPWLRSKAKTEKTAAERAKYKALADGLETALKVAKVNVTQAASMDMSGKEKKATAVTATANQLAEAGIKDVDIDSVVEAAYSAQKSELKTNYSKQAQQSASLPKPITGGRNNG